MQGFSAFDLSLGLHRMTVLWSGQSGFHLGLRSGSAATAPHKCCPGSGRPTCSSGTRLPRTPRPRPLWPTSSANDTPNKPPNTSLVVFLVVLRVYVHFFMGCRGLLLPHCLVSYAPRPALQPSHSYFFFELIIFHHFY